MSDRAAVDAERRADRARLGDALRSRRRARGAPTTSSGAGRSRTSRASGPRSGSSSTSHAATPYERVLGEREMPGAQWFPGARLSYAEHVFRDRDDDGGRDPPRERAARAVASGRGASCARRRRAIAAGLRALGVEPRRPRRRLHAEHPRDRSRRSWRTRRSARCGRACSPDFGARSVVDRFAQIEPKVLLAVDGYRYGGRDFDRRERGRGHRRARSRRSSTSCASATSTAAGWPDGLVGRATSR